MVYFSHPNQSVQKQKATDRIIWFICTALSTKRTKSIRTEYWI